jgi:D-glycero-alpha-D-manno-heptose 1-phosphate guanylyltransferase
MLKEAIILAGGLGTRLKGVVDDMPKPMARIGKKPFLTYLFTYLKKYGINKVVLAVGYKHEAIKNYYGKQYKGIAIKYAIETEPLGTGGAIANALKHIKHHEVFLLNGDSFFDVNLEGLFTHHELLGADLTLSLKEMTNFNRYGTVELEDSQIINFHEKKELERGFINGGVYILHKKIFSDSQLPTKFSFETDIMEAKVNDYNFQAFKSDGYFIDIGIPEDYKKAQLELPKLV